MIKVIRLTELTDKSKALKAFCDISLSDKIVIRGCRVVQGQNGIFVAMPQTKGGDGQWYPIVTIRDEALRKSINEEVIKRFTGTEEEEPTPEELL